jgi:uncharacterized membrane protein AbrB (regulator of aidB expression)
MPCDNLAGFPAGALSCAIVVATVRWPMVMNARFLSDACIIPLGKLLAANRNERVKPATTEDAGPSFLFVESMVVVDIDVDSFWIASFSHVFVWEVSFFGDAAIVPSAACVIISSNVSSRILLDVGTCSCRAAQGSSMPPSERSQRTDCER